MTSHSPDQVGPYKIIREIGRGGMGVVYLARDTKLDRDVAIKCLPDELSDDADRLARFEREAKLLASLNHPNIATIHGLEEVDGKRYLILEYVEGETLEDKLNAGAIPVDEALVIAKQIAEAIEAAHEKGVIHRDLKPANIKFTSDEQVKVLDFGLAKALSIESSTASGLANSPTIVAGGSPTLPGLVLGTAGYLSPEQARGRPVDKRTDIFSFGCILYEMLTGQRVFPGENATDAIGASLHAEVNWNPLPPGTPPTIQLLLRRCLAKDRKRRLHDIADARLEIENAIADPTSSSLGLATAALDRERERGMQRRWKRCFPWAAGLAIGAAGAWVVSSQWQAQSTHQAAAGPLRFDLPLKLDEAAPEYGITPSSLALAPDGSAIVCAFRGAGRRLVVRELDSINARILDGTAGATSPFFSPDGRWIGFFQDGHLLRIPRDGGAPLPICNAAATNEAAVWMDDGTIIVVGDRRTLLATHETGGDLVEFVTAALESGILGFETLCRIPGQSYFLAGGYTGNTIEADRVVAISLDDGSIETVVSKGGDPSVVSDGFVVFLRDSTLYAMRFDIDGRKALGPEMRVLDGVTANRWGGVGTFDVSWNGTLCYVPGQRYSVGRRLVWVDRTRKVEPVSETRDAFVAGLRISPDGKRIAVNTLRRGLELWSFEVEPQTMLRLNAVGECYSFAWDPTGKRLAFERMDPDKGYDVSEVFIRDVSGGALQRLPLEGHRYYPYAWLPEGKGLLLSRTKDLPPPRRDVDLFVFRFEGDEGLVPYLETDHMESDAALSNSGAWVAYKSNETGRSEVFLRVFPNDERQWQVSFDGMHADAPIRWAPRDTEIYWVANDRMMSASVETEPGVSVGVPTALFASPWPSAPERWDTFDVGPDGRFLMIEPAEWEQKPRDVRVILHWNRELQRRMRGASE